MTLTEFIDALQHAKDVHGGDIPVRIELEHAVFQDDELEYNGFCAMNDEITLWIGKKDEQ